MLRMHHALALSATLFFVACDTAPKDIFIEEETPHAQLGKNVAPTAYAIDFMMDPQADAMSGTVTIDIEIEKPTTRIWLHGRNIEAEAVTATQGSKEFSGVFTELSKEEAPSGIARIDFEKPLRAGSATLSIPYSTPYNTTLNSAYKVVRGEDAYIVTQMEPLGAREAFPSFDEPRFKVPFNVTISSPSENVVFFNTPEVEQKELGNGWTKYTYQETRPLPTYLIAFGAGPYDVVDYGDIPPNDIRTRPIRLRGLAARGSGEQLDYALKNTPGLLGALEGYFGSEYPYEKLDLIAAPDYAFGAMENPGAIVYREYLLLLDDNAPLSQKRAYARVHSHELAHQWFGNLVTPVWWEDIWLNEAFATWSGNKGTHLWRPEGNYDRLTLNAALGAMSIDSLASTRQIQEPLLRSENVMDQFDGITYRKGGGVLSMFESYLGEDVFQKGVQLHMERFNDDVATSEDFFQSLADGSGNPDVVPAMKSFVNQPGLPLVTGEMSCSEGVTELKLSQSRYAPLGSTILQGQTWHIPVCASFGVGDEVSKSCTLMKEPEATLTLDASGCASWSMLNADGAGYYRFSLDKDSWLELIKNSDQLTTREVLATLDSLEAAYRAGEIDSETYLAGARVFAAHPEYDVSSQAGDMLGFFDAHLPEESKPALAKLTRDMYEDRYRRFAGTDTNDGNLHAPTMAARLISYGDDKALEAQFAGQGAVYLGLDGEADKSIIESNMLSRALRATMKLRSDDAYKPLLAMASGGSAFEKGAAIGALGETDDPAIAQRLLDQALNSDEITGRQATSLVYVLLGNDAHRDMVWEWLKSNFDVFVEKRVADVRKPGMPSAGGVFCTEERATEVESFFESKAEVIPGYERSLAQSLESIRLCAALKDAKAEEMAAALE